MEKKLYRNEHDKVVAGVASGLATYMQVDVTIIRILFVLSTIFLMGAGLLIYIIMWIIVPVNNDPNAKFSQFNDFFKQSKPTDDIFNGPNAFNNPQNSGTQTKWNTENDFGASPNFDFSKLNKSNESSKTILGLVLLVLGIYFLLHSLGLIPYFNIFKLYKLWPLAIIALGISLIFKNQRKNEWTEFKHPKEETTASTKENVVNADEVVADKKEDEELGHS